MKQKLLNNFRLWAFMFVAFVCAAFTTAWAQNDFSTDYTGNVTLSTSGGTNASTCKVTISGTDYNGIKAGTSKNAGAAVIVVPQGTKYLHIHAAAWNGETVALVVTPSGYSSNISLTTNSGISGNSPFTFSGDPSSDNFYKVIEFASALEAETSLTFTASGGKRFVIWGVTAEADGGSGDESVVTTIAIDASGITNTNVFEGTDAGSLAATVSVKDGDPIDGATVTWSGNNDEVATINAATGAVTLVAAGSVTFTASYAGVENTYKPSTKSYAMTVINVDPNAPGSVNNPYSVADAITYIGTLGTNPSPNEVYVSGIISQVDSYNSTYKSITYWISDNGTTTGQMEVYSGKGLDGADFSAVTDLLVGDVVTVKGIVKKYNTTYEFDKNNTIVSLVRKPATPTFSPVAGAVVAGTPVAISTKTDGATIYYTTDGTEPTTTSSVYSAPIEITTAVTIKAIAVKDQLTSEVATAEYTINAEPTIDLGVTSVQATAAGLNGTINVTYNNLTDVLAEVQFFEKDGTTPATYDWIDAEINSSNNVEYIVDENESASVRTAYMKVYAVGNEGDVYSDLITITQAGIDYTKLPFAWNGGTKEDLLGNTGVTANGLGTNYAESNAPYRVKLDTDGDYIQVKTDCQPVLVSVDVKMLGGATQSSITVQESADGDTFTDVEDLTISGSTNSVLYLQTASDFKADTRYVRLYFTKGSNVGVGGIAIEKAFEDAVTIGEIGYATYVTKHNVSFPTDVKAYIGKINNEYVTLTEVTAVAKGTPVILKGAGEYALAPAAASELADVSTNDLKATTKEIEATGKYVLAKPDGKPVGFYLAESGTIEAYKAYLEVSGSTDVRGFIFDGDAETAIANVNVNVNDNQTPIYNLAGQRVSKLQKGINIVNGKKILK